MIVDDLYIFGACGRPTETDPELIVNADAMLPGAVTLERFEPVSGRHSEVFQSSRDLQLSQLAPCDGFDVSESSNAMTVCKRLGVGTP